ncbi:MAG: hypothetical protein ACRDV7_14365 [Acidimicrobiia bacterium]
MAESTTLTGAAVARRLLDAIVTRDFDSLRAILAADVWMRALLPREIVETHSAADTTEIFRGWLAPHDALKVLATEQHTVEGREFLSYNLLLRPDWAPDVWHAIEQSGYCRVVNDRVTRIDLVCTGYFPTDVDAAQFRSAQAPDRG